MGLPAVAPGGLHVYDGHNHQPALADGEDLHRHLEQQKDDRRGDNTFLSARPQDPLGLDEKATLKTVHDKGEGPAAVITGDVLYVDSGFHNVAGGLTADDPA